MKLVNITSRNVYNAATGTTVAPGKKTPDVYRDLEKVLAQVVKVCGNNFGIILNENEADLIRRVVDLDEVGEKFDPMTIPAEIRNDPLGTKRASEMSRKAQQAAIDADKKANSEKAMREAIINGEVDERMALQGMRRPVGPATMEGEEVVPSKLKSGFEAILEENKRIAQEDNKKQTANTQEMLDPIGAHVKKEGSAEPAPAENDGTGIGDAKPIEQAHNREDDGTRSADTAAPLPSVGDRAGAMDRQAAETARKLSTIGPEPAAQEPTSENKEETQDTQGTQEAPAGDQGQGTNESNQSNENEETDDGAKEDKNSKDAKKGSKEGSKRGNARKAKRGA